MKAPEESGAFCFKLMLCELIIFIKIQVSIPGPTQPHLQSLRPHK